MGHWRRKKSEHFLVFAEGFHAVFPMEKLGPFTPDELQLMLSGEQVPQWTREDIMNYTEPKFGYTRETPGFQRFVNVLVNMNGDERKVRKLHFLLRIEERGAGRGVRKKRMERGKGGWRTEGEGRKGKGGGERVGRKGGWGRREGRKERREGRKERREGRKERREGRKGKGGGGRVGKNGGWREGRKGMGGGGRVGKEWGVEGG